MHTNKTKAFTLVEMLMIVAIIMLLAAILLPALRNARYVAQRTMCLSNQHQLYVAARTFGNDNNEWLPYCRGWNESAAGGWSLSPKDLYRAGDWYSVTGYQFEVDLRAPQGSTLAPYFGLNPKKPRPDALRTVNGIGPDGTFTQLVWGGYEWPWTVVKNIMTCPGVTGKNREYWPSYGLNLYISCGTKQGPGQNGDWPLRADLAPYYDWSRMKFSDFKKPAEIYMFGDRMSAAEVVTWGPAANEWIRTFFGTYEPFMAGWWGSACAPDATPTSSSWAYWDLRAVNHGVIRHGKRNVRVYVDGHAEMYNHPACWKLCCPVPGGASLNPPGWVEFDVF